MSNVNYLYAFLGGVVVGKTTNIISSLFISGLILYITDTTLFSQESFEQIKNKVLMFVN